MKAISLQVEDTDIGMYLLCKEFLLGDCYPVTLVPNRDEIRRSEEDDIFEKPVQFYLNKNSLHNRYIPISVSSTCKLIAFI